MNRMSTSLRVRLLALALLTGLVSYIQARETLATIDYPGATWTNAYRLTDSGVVVGAYAGADGLAHGFVWNQGQFTAVDVPGARQTWAYGINASLDIVGQYVDSTGKNLGFLLRKGAFTTIEVPGAVLTGAFSINSAGEAVGHFQMPGRPMQGFIWRDGALSVLDYRPGAPSNSMNCFFAINDAGDAAGHWGTDRGSRHGVLFRNGAYTQLDFGGGGYTDAEGINNSGEISGFYRDAALGVHGFVLRNGRFTPVNYPEAAATLVFGINNAGEVAGYYRDAAGKVHGFVMTAPMEPEPKLITVDDDGADCPNSVKTIQEAVQTAPAGSTILVCAGTYRNTVKVLGHDKDGLKLIGAAGPDKVTLQGDYTERTGFHLEDVNGVLVQGFTIRDFGTQATTDKLWGDGANIYMKNSHYNTIRSNRMYNGDMVGIWFQDAGNNNVEDNQIFITTAALANCGMHLGGAGSANNYIRQNTSIGNKMAGIMLSGAGPGNILIENILTNNGRAGIQNGATNGTWIEGNRVSYNRGPWGTSPYAAEFAGIGNGINITDSTGLTVFDNRARNNTGLDINWDGKGEIKFEANSCEKGNPAGACSR